MFLLKETFVAVLMGVVVLSSGAVFKNGTSPQGIFNNPIHDQVWPDPYCYLHTDGYYYMPRSEANGIALYRSETLHNWRSAFRAIVYTVPNGLANLWAPEVHFIQGNFYLYFAMDNGDNAQHRMYVTRALNPNQPQGAYTAAKRLFVPGEDYWAIDGTILKYNNGPGGSEQLYMIWSGWPQADSGFPQNLYIAPMSDPETISGGRVLIHEPTEPWQMLPPLLEGPQVLQNAGRTFIIFSASASWGPEYSLGFMGIDGMADPLNRNNWWRHPEQIFWTNEQERVYGVGHASLTTSKDGRENWIVYHAMADPGAGWEGRTARVQKFGWNPDNSPAFPRPLGFGVGLDTPSGE